MELEHREFLKEHYYNYETAKSGYVRNLDLPILRIYEHIYKTYLNASFILTIWCAACRMEMLMRLYAYYETLPIEKIIEPTQVNIIKKTKKKTNG